METIRMNVHSQEYMETMARLAGSMRRVGMAADETLAAWWP